MDMKIKLNYGGGWDTILLDLHNNIIYSFEMNLEILKKKYNLEIKYMSRSNLTCEAILETNDLIKLGQIRQDAKNMQKCEQMKSTTTYTTLDTYVTTLSHSGINQRGKIIISDSNKIAFFNIEGVGELRRIHESYYDDFKKALFDWVGYWEEKEKEKEKDIIYNFSEKLYDLELFESELTFKAIGNFHGYDLKRFLWLKSLQIIDSDLKTYKNRRITELLNKHNIFYYKNKFISLGFRNTIKQIYNNYEEALLEQGFSIFNDEYSKVYYKLNKINTTDYETPTYIYYGFGLQYGLKEYNNNDILFEYESEVSYLEDEPLEKMSNEINEKILQKIKNNHFMKNKENFTKKDAYIKLLITKYEKIKLDISYQLGNCKIGTHAFLAKNKILINKDDDGEYVLRSDLLKNKNLTQMLKSNSFIEALFFI